MVCAISMLKKRLAMTETHTKNSFDCTRLLQTTDIMKQKAQRAISLYFKLRLDKCLTCVSWALLPF